MGRKDDPGSTGGYRRIDRPDATVAVVRAAEARAEQYRVILPRQDRVGWRMARIEAEPSRVELVSTDLCGATGIHLSVVTLGPGIRDEPHWHVMGEKVMYVTEGRGEIVCGDDLATVHAVERGDAVYVPPFAVHAPRNASSEPFTFVMVASAPMDVSIPG